MDSSSGTQTATDLLPGWYAVALAHRVGRRPVRIVLHDRPYVLWRTGDGLACVSDLCPHRGAPLSMGRVIDDAVACPYHGWRFGADGECRHMPALTGPCLKVRVEALDVREQDGLILIGWRHPAKAPRSIMPGATLRRISGQVRTTVADVAENILDTTHTSVLHAGYLRRPGASRRVTPRIEVGPDWIAAIYPPQAAPSGVMGWLIGSGYDITDRFHAPNIADVEYRRKGRLEFAIRFHLTPAAKGVIALYAVMAVPGKGPFAWLKLALIEAALKRVFAEDTAILEAVAHNRADHGRSPVTLAPQDLLRRGIDALLRGDTPSAPKDVPDLYI